MIRSRQFAILKRKIPKVFSFKFAMAPESYKDRSAHSQITVSNIIIADSHLVFIIIFFFIQTKMPVILNSVITC